MRNGLAALSALALAGCATTPATSLPLSTITGTPYTKTDPHIYPVRIVAVDGEEYFSARNPDGEIHLVPGPHWIVAQADPAKSARKNTEKSFAYKIEPCTRINFAAERETPMSAEWKLVVDHQETVKACNPDEEMAKAAARAKR